MLSDATVSVLVPVTCCAECPHSFVAGRGHGIRCRKSTRLKLWGLRNFDPWRLVHPRCPYLPEITRHV